MSDKVKLYEEKMWKGVVPLFACSKCAYTDVNEDNMKLHVAGHFPPEQGSQILDMLVELPSEEKGQG